MQNSVTETGLLFTLKPERENLWAAGQSVGSLTSDAPSPRDMKQAATGSVCVCLHRHETIKQVQNRNIPPYMSPSSPVSRWKIGSHTKWLAFLQILFLSSSLQQTHSSGNFKLSCHVLENITMTCIHFLEQHDSQRLQLNICFNDSFAPVSKTSELRCYQTSLNSLTSSLHPQNNS